MLRLTGSLMLASLLLLPASADASSCWRDRTAPRICARAIDSTICAGARNHEVHRTYIIARLTDRWGNPLVGRTVRFAPQHPGNHIRPLCNPPTARTDRKGFAITALTSGDGAISGRVDVHSGGGSGEADVEFIVPEYSFTITDAETGSEDYTRRWNGRQKLRVMLRVTCEGWPVPRHEIHWHLKRWAYTSDREGPPDFVGTSSEQWGTLSPTTTTTDRSGRASVEYTLGTQAGWDSVRADDQHTFIPK